MHDDILKRLKEALGESELKKPGAKPSKQTIQEAIAKQMGMDPADVDVKMVPVSGDDPVDIAAAIKQAKIDTMKSWLNEAAIIAFCHDEVLWAEGDGCKVGAFRNGERAICVVAAGGREGGYWTVIPLFALEGFAKHHNKKTPGLAALVDQAKALVNYNEFEDGCDEDNGDASGYKT